MVQSKASRSKAAKKGWATVAGKELLLNRAARGESVLCRFPGRNSTGAIQMNSITGTPQAITLVCVAAN